MNCSHFNKCINSPLNRIRKVRPFAVETEMQKDWASKRYCNKANQSCSEKSDGRIITTLKEKKESGRAGLLVLQPLLFLSSFFVWISVHIRTIEQFSDFLDVQEKLENLNKSTFS